MDDLLSLVLDMLIGAGGWRDQERKDCSKNVIKVILLCELHIIFCLEPLLAGMALKLNCASDP